MPRFFDDYSHTYLTHDSSAGRKQQRRGWKFVQNFKLHYEPHVKEWQSGEMGLAAAQQAFIKMRGKDDPAVTPLPDGWKELVDDVTGIPFYEDTRTGKRTWTRPGFIPPPPGAVGPPPNVTQQQAPPPQPFQQRPPPHQAPFYQQPTTNYGGPPPQFQQQPPPPNPYPPPGNYP